MRILTPTAMFVLLLMAPATATPASAATLCVGASGGCYRGLQGAVDAAADGDTIRVGPGVYRGGVTIDKSVVLRGAGATATRIRGGGPVLTLGSPTGPTTIALTGVSIRDGVRKSTTVDGEELPFLALGGGVQILPDASVTIADSAVVDNVAAPGETITSPSGADCPDGTCPFAGGYGAGIYSEGSLTLARTLVARNRNGGPVSSDAEGGGIFSTGPLTLRDSRVVGNESHVRPPLGRFATGGGVFASAGRVTIRRSAVSGNRTTLDSEWPSSVGQGAIGAGVFIDNDADATIDRSRIEDNDLRVADSAGDAVAFSGGVHGNGPVSIRDSVIASNHVTATVPPGSDSLASADSGMGNLNRAGTITGSRLVGNTVTAVGGIGPAFAAAGSLWAFSDDPLALRDSVVSGNRVTATTDGEVTAHGGGLVNTDVLSVRDTRVSRNTVRASGGSGEARGGGIWNGTLPDAGDLVPQLRVFDSAITANTIGAAGAVDVEGGGLFTDRQVTLERALIEGNRPDECAGC